MHESTCEAVNDLSPALHQPSAPQGHPPRPMDYATNYPTSLVLKSHSRSGLVSAVCWASQPPPPDPGPPVRTGSGLALRTPLTYVLFTNKSKNNNEELLNSTREHQVTMKRKTRGLTLPGVEQ